MLPREVWTSVSFPIWVSEPSLLHSSSETQTASSSNIEHVCCSQKEQGSHVKLNSSKGNRSRCERSSSSEVGNRHENSLGLYFCSCGLDLYLGLGGRK